MTSVAVVTKRAGLTLTMQAPGHRFSEVRPVAEWLERSWSEDVLVLDLESADLALDAIETLRAAGVDAPLIMVANDTDGWDEVIALHPDLFLVSLPLSPPALLATVERAARAARSPLAASTVDVTPAAEVVIGAVRGAPTPTLQPPSPAVPPPRPDTVDRPPRERIARREQEARPDPAPEAPAADRRKPRGAADAASLVRDLHAVVALLSRVPEVAEVVRQRCADAVSCDASTVLVPDGDAWRVAAGANLRPLEHRFQIDAAHWLVSEVVRNGHGVLIRDTDIARNRLAGAPLASWPNLLAIPVPEVDGIVLLARDTKPFTRKDLTRVRPAIGQAATQLKEAYDVRALARALAPFTDPVD